MGWARGSELAEQVWDSVKRSIHPGARQKIARRIVDLFEDADADDWDYDREDGVYVIAYPELAEEFKDKEEEWGIKL